MWRSTREKMLKNIGLTNNQAKVYLALLDSGPSKVSEITKITEVARPNLYPILEGLQRLGIIEKILTAPTRYRAIPLKEAVELLMDTKTLEYENAKVAAELICAIPQREQQAGSVKEIDAQFILIPEGKTLLNRIAAAIEAAEHSVEIAVSWRRFVQGVTIAFAESLEKIGKKKVKIRAITEKPPKHETAVKVIETFKEKTNGNIRFLFRKLPAIFGLYDKKVFIVSMTEADLRAAPALWSTSKPLTSLVSEYFEYLWTTATENTIQKNLH
ncbi:MAG: helix-turn-helix domain-containing protein [Candidatus Bathyarchaeia archaeon]